MKILSICLLLILTIGAHAAAPSFTDFNTNQFGTTGNRVVVKSGALLTNAYNNGIAIGAGTAGTMINTGANVVGNIPRASDTSPTNYVPSLLIVDGSGNVTGVNSLETASLSVGTLTVTNKLARSIITNGTPDHIVINDGTGLLSSEATLGATRFPALTGDVTSAGGSLAMTIADNSVDGSDIALGSDAQGDVMFYNGTDWARLAAGTSGQFLKTLGVGANPLWDTAAAGSGTAGTLINTTTPVTLYELFRAKDTTGTNAEPSMLTYDNATLVLGTNAAAPANKRITGSVPTGANTVGATLTIQSPSGTGTAAGGSLIWQVSPAGGSSSVTNPAVTGLTLAVDAQSTATIATTVAGRLRVADGTAALPSIVFSSDDDASGTGFYRPSADKISVVASGVYVGSFFSGRFDLASTTQISWANADLYLTREGAGILQQGIDSVTPIAQTYKGPDGQGSNIAAVNNKVGPGRSTGAAIPGIVQVEVGTTGAAASTQNTYATAVGLGGTLKVDTTTTGNVGAGEDDLISYSIPAGQLSKDGSFIEFDVFGTFAANANTAQLKVYFDGVAFFDTTSLLFNGVAWKGHGKIIRTGAATQKITIEFTVGGTLLSAVNSTVTVYATDNATLSGATIFKITGQDTGGVPADNKVVQEAAVLRWFPGQ